MNTQDKPEMHPLMVPREILFRGICKDGSKKGQFVYGSYHYTKGDSVLNWWEWDKDMDRVMQEKLIKLDEHYILVPKLPTDNGWNFTDTYKMFDVEPETVGQYAGLPDKNGVKIFEGDIIHYRKPYRTTQTHTGDNIPNGSYTEPMEPGIKEYEGVVGFKDGMFVVDSDEGNGQDMALWWCINEWDLNDVKEAISWMRPDAFIFDDPEEGDLQYLINEVAKVKDADELLRYLSGVTVIGNVHQQDLNNNH